MTLRIACLGGSNTLGVRTTRGYPEHLPYLLPGRPIVYNLGIPGAKTLDVLRGLPAAFRSLPGAVDVAIFGLPFHDAQGGGVPPKELEALLGLLIDQVVDYRCKLILCTPTPIAIPADQKGEVKGFGRPSRRWIEKAVQVVATSAAALDLPVVPWHTMPKELLADAVHPSPAGCLWQAQQVAKVLG